MTSRTHLSRLFDAPLLEQLADGRLRVAGSGPAKILVPICAGTVRMDNRPDPDGYRRLRFRREEAAGYLTDKDGQFVEPVVDGSYRLQTYHLCLNHPLTVRRLLELIGQVMEEGADGIVLRFREPPQECHAENWHVGFVKRFDSIASQVPWMATYDRRILALDTHRHLHRDRRQQVAFRALAAKARRLVKRYGRQRILVVESDGDWTGRADARLIVSTLADLPRALEAAVADRRHPLLVAPRSDLPLAVEEVFRATALCLLDGAACVLPRAALARLAGVRALPVLGPRLTPPTAFGAVTYAVHANGVVAVNGSDCEQILRLKLPARYAHRALVDLRTGQILRVAPGGTIPDISIHDYAERLASDRDLLVRLPAGAGRIFCATGHRRIRP